MPGASLLPNNVVVFDDIRNDIHAVCWSLDKWRQLRKDCMDKHNLQIEIDENWPIVIYENDDYFVVNANSCPLCYRYLDGCKYPCEMCPLKQKLGSSCDDYNAPFDLYFDTGDPTEMIEALECVYFTLLNDWEVYSIYGAVAQEENTYYQVAS